ncbi:MAG: PIN domain-containing protein [Candidatus Brocadiales bacterium]|nr:PIN domain-containing protein [Candidatus Brocadiales bacterium]
MKIVVDSNIIFSALISGKEIYLDIFKMNDVYMPDVVFSELNKYESHLVRKTKLNQTEFKMFVQMLFEEVAVIPKFAISVENWQNAYKICKNVDEKDTPFIALCFELGIPLWTNDKTLCEGIKLGFDNFVTTEELLKKM